MTSLPLPAIASGDTSPGAADSASDPQILPEVGVVEPTDPDRGRIIFPAPYPESIMNVLVLRR